MNFGKDKGTGLSTFVSCPCKNNQSLMSLPVFMRLPLLKTCNNLIAQSC